MFEDYLQAAMVFTAAYLTYWAIFKDLENDD